MTVLGASAGAASTSGIDHTFGGKASKTFTASMADVRVATRTSLKEMSIDIAKVSDDGPNFTVEAKAGERTIEIELESLTKTLTGMHVTVVEPGGIFNDSATATEIILQTAERLNGQVAENPNHQRGSL